MPLTSEQFLRMYENLCAHESTTSIIPTSSSTTMLPEEKHSLFARVCHYIWVLYIKIKNKIMPRPQSTTDRETPPPIVDIRTATINGNPIGEMLEREINNSHSPRTHVEGTPTRMGVGFRTERERDVPVEPSRRPMPRPQFKEGDMVVVQRIPSHREWRESEWGQLVGRTIKLSLLMNENPFLWKWENMPEDARYIDEAFLVLAEQDASWSKMELMMMQIYGELNRIRLIMSENSEVGKEILNADKINAYNPFFNKKHLFEKYNGIKNNKKNFFEKVERAKGTNTDNT